MPTDLILICHGHTAKRDGERRYGWWADMPLSRWGKRQAVVIGERLRNDFDIRALYASPQRCAWQTAERIGDLVHVVPQADDALRELESGDLTTLSCEEAREYYPGVLEGQSPEEARVPGCETDADMHNRVARAVSRIVHLSPDQQIACVTHSRPIVACLQAIMGYMPEDERKPLFACRTAAIHHLQLDPQGDPTVIAFNDTAHLTNLPTQYQID